MLAWQDENGNIPPDGIPQALEQRDAFLQQNLDEDGFGDMPVSGLNWVSRGPDNVGGRTRSVVVNPADSNIIWAGSVGGGVWKSTNRGEIWQASNGALQNYIVTALALDPTDLTHRTLYATTGEYYFNQGFSGIPGGGIFKSTDGGMSWNRLPSTNPMLPDNDVWSLVGDISIAPGTNDNVVVLAGNYEGVKRSINGGSDWTTVAAGAGSRFVSFAPNDGSKAIAEVVNSSGVPSVMWSSNANATATTWNLATITIDGNNQNFALGGSKRIELAYSRVIPQLYMRCTIHQAPLRLL